MIAVIFVRSACTLSSAPITRLAYVAGKIAPELTLAILVGSKSFQDTLLATKPFTGSILFHSHVYRTALLYPTENPLSHSVASRELAQCMHRILIAPLYYF